MRREQPAGGFLLTLLEVVQEGPCPAQGAKRLEATLQEGLQFLQPGQLRR